MGVCFDSQKTCDKNKCHNKNSETKICTWDDPNNSCVCCARSYPIRRLLSEELKDEKDHEWMVWDDVTQFDVNHNRKLLC